MLDEKHLSRCGQLGESQQKSNENLQSVRSKGAFIDVRCNGTQHIHQAWPAAQRVCVCACQRYELPWQAWEAGLDPLLVGETLL